MIDTAKPKPQILIKDILHYNQRKEGIQSWSIHFEKIELPLQSLIFSFRELIAWYGMAVAGQHLGMYLAWLVMVCYLSGRSHQTHLWYLKKIENFPKDRRNIFPGIF